MQVSEERLVQIRELAIGEWLDLVDTSALGSADLDRFRAEARAKALAFCRENSNPDELHAFASNWNWDWGFEPLREIIANPACEAGTALYIYWVAKPEWFLQYADRDALADRPHERDLFDFLADLEARYTAGAYAVGSIAFDPTSPFGSDAGPEYSLVGIYDDMRATFVRSLPEMMYEPIDPSQ